MISGRFKGIREAFKNCFSVMMDHGGFPMHKSGGSNNLTSKCIGQGLMPETDAKEGETAGKMLDDGNRNARLVRCTGAW